ncbi:hypothetical protein LTR86_007320 [Recurvomyces mirabilis]|nr:hypothetical protein LTR86_007320 [Recurvomyces mirabilis]
MSTNPSHPPPSAAIDYTAQPTQIIVGKDEHERTFYIHPGQFSKHSKFFAAALKAPWKEAEEGVIRLPNERYDDFSVFANFIYDRKLRCWYSTPSPEDLAGIQQDVASGRTVLQAGETIETIVSLNQEYENLCDYWLLGDVYMATSFQDAVMDGLITVVQSLMDRRQLLPALHDLAYTRTAGANALRRLSVDIVAWNLDKIKSDFPIEFYKDLALRSVKVQCGGLKSGKAPFEEEGCEYHEHVAAGTDCYKTMS